MLGNAHNGEYIEPHISPTVWLCLITAFMATTITNKASAFGPQTKDAYNQQHSLHQQFYPNATILDESESIVVKISLDLTFAKTRQNEENRARFKRKRFKRLLSVGPKEDLEHIIIESTVEENINTSEVSTLSEVAISADTVIVKVNKNISKRQLQRAIRRLRNNDLNIRLKRKIRIPGAGTYLIQFKGNTVHIVNDVIDAIRTLPEVKTVEVNVMHSKCAHRLVHRISANGIWRKWDCRSYGKSKLSQTRSTLY